MIKKSIPQIYATSLYLFYAVFSIFIILSCPVDTAYGQKDNSQCILFADNNYGTLKPGELLELVNSFTKELPLESINIVEPLPDTVLPADMASPVFSWEDPSQSTAWLITIKSNKKILLKALLDTYWWIPDAVTWEKLQKTAEYKTLEVIIEGIGGWSGREIISQNHTSFKFSRDRVNARLMFIRKPIPFKKAKIYPELTKLVAGYVSSYEKPEVIMSDLTTCINCHTYSPDGRVFAMDIDYGGDKGAFTMASMKPEMKLDKSDIFSWNALAVRKPAFYSMGLFAQVSPGGRYIAATINETAVFVIMDDLYFSQLFVPTSGQIAIFDSRTKKFSILEGADQEGVVYTSPAWSPDGKTIIFSRVPANPDLIRKVLSKQVSKESPKQKIEDLNKKYRVQFDIYTLPFNHEKGTLAKPLKGASQNGYSNYFPRYSPNGKWIVFTQSPTGSLLQPDSKLVIIPSRGGEARLLSSNQPVLNSWHSWSPNSKWMVFTCKANSPYTELYLTHIDEKGVASPGVRLFRFSSNNFAALVPEFIPKHAQTPESITFKSLQDLKVKNSDIFGK